MNDSRRLPGCEVQYFPEDRTSNGNYFVLFISEEARRNRDQVFEALKVSGIQSKRYFYPPVYEQTIFQHFPLRVSAQLEQTIKASREALALPLYAHIDDAQLERVCRRVEELLGTGLIHELDDVEPEQDPAALPCCLHSAFPCRRSQPARLLDTIRGTDPAVILAAVGCGCCPGYCSSGV